MNAEFQHTRRLALIDDLRVLPAETPWVEFKENVNDPQIIGKLISALSNAARLHDQHFAYVLWGLTLAGQSGMSDPNKLAVGQKELLNLSPSSTTRTMSSTNKSSPPPVVRNGTVTIPKASGGTRTGYVVNGTTYNNARDAFMAM